MIKLRMNWLFAMFLISSIWVASIIADDDTFTVYISTDGNDVTGDGSSGNPFATIFGAVTAYNTANNNSAAPYYFLTINVKEGNYSGVNNIQVTLPASNITIQNQDDKIDTVYFDCQFAYQDAFLVTEGSFQLSYINVQNCERAIEVAYAVSQDYQDIYIYQCSFSNILTNAIYVDNPSSMRVEACYFSSPAGNLFSNYIYVFGTFEAGIDVLENQFLYGVGVKIQDMNGGNINNNVFANLTTPPGQDSYALYLTGGVWDIESNQFNYITTYQSAAVNLYNSLSDSTQNATFTLKSNSFNACQNPTSFGGAITISGDPTAIIYSSIEDSSFSNNAATMGGAIFIKNGNVTVEKCTFTANNASLSGAAIDIEEATALFLYDNSFDNNVLKDGTPSTLACCTLSPATCTATLLVNDNAQGDYSDSTNCEVQYVSTEEYFDSLPSYPYQPFSTPSSSSLWWVWVLVSFALIATIVVVGAAAGVFVYTQKKRKYESVE